MVAVVVVLVVVALAVEVKEWGWRNALTLGRWDVDGGDWMI